MCALNQGAKERVRGFSILGFRFSIGVVAGVVVSLTVASSRADEVISRAWTIQNVLEPTFTEAISRAITDCNIGVFVDEDGDTVHDCNDVCPGGNDLVDADNNNIPDACEPGSCCFMAGGFPGCFNSNKLECESPPYNGVYGGEGSSCTQNVAIILEPSGDVFIHAIGPPADCGPATPPTCSGSGNPPYTDAWVTPATGVGCHSFDPADGGTPIPVGFFAPGSDPFTGQVCLHGISLNDDQDTLQRRNVYLDAERVAAVHVQAAKRQRLARPDSHQPDDLQSVRACALGTRDQSDVRRGG